MHTSLLHFSKRLGLLYLFSLFVLSVNAQKTSIIPAPAQIQFNNGSFQITSNTVVGISTNENDIVKIASYLVDKLKPATGLSLKITEGNKQAGIQLSLNKKPDARLGKEGYTFESSASNVYIAANTPAGLFHGVQTLFQLLPSDIESKNQVTGISWQIPAVSIVDYPRFQWRGIMLDVSRHFFPKEYVKTYIDQLSHYRSLACTSHRYVW
jgi:hexosaminidase